MKLTDSALARLDLGNHVEKIVKDSKLTGFAARARRNAQGGISVAFFVIWQERRNGKRVTHKHGIGTWRDPWTADSARRQAEEMLRARDAGESVENAWAAAKKEQTLAELFDDFERDHVATLAEKTQAEYKSLASRRIRLKLGTKRITELSREDIRTWHAGMADTPFEANRALAVMSRAMRYAVERSKRDDNPCIGVSRFKERPREDWLDEQTLPKFAEKLFAGTTPHHALIQFLLYSGWRVGEAIELTFEALDSDFQVATIETKTGRQRRHLSEPAADVLRAVEHRTGYVFSGRGGRQGIGYKHVRETMLDVCSEAGIPAFTPHALRRGAATMAAVAGASILELREAFGWKTPTMASRYVKAADSLGKAGARKAADAIGAAIRIDKTSHV